MSNSERPERKTDKKAPEYYTSRRCPCCGHAQLDVECENCSRPACSGWFGACCSCGNDYIIAKID